MKYNICNCCGANDGRAGTLFSDNLSGYDDFCRNCKDTFITGNVALHSDLSRTDEEINIMISKLFQARAGSPRSTSCKGETNHEN